MRTGTNSVNVLKKMSALVFLVLLSSCAVMQAQQQKGRCDITQDVVTYTSCAFCFLNAGTICPNGTTQTTTGQGIGDCTIFLFITGCRHRCLSTRVVTERCCDDYWGTNCDRECTVAVALSVQTQLHLYYHRH